MSENSRELAELIAQRFISRRDVKAVQVRDGGYRPINEPFQMADLIAHVQGKGTFGHYMLDQDSKCKLFAFDIDLNEGDCERRTKEFFPHCCQTGHGNWIEPADLETMPEFDDMQERDEWFRANSLTYPARPRDSWLDRSHPGRNWWKYQMRTLGDMLASRIRKGLGVPALVTYTGGKGIHVYGFTGHMDAAEVREGAISVLESFNQFIPAAGQNFYRDSNDHWYGSFSNFTIEVFPKQTKVEPGHYGNLMRLPFGKNMKNPHDPTFIVDERRPSTSLAPIPDPTQALRVMDAFKGQPKWN